MPAEETKAKLLRKYDKDEKYHSKKKKNKYLVSLKCKPIDWNTSATTWVNHKLNADKKSKSITSNPKRKTIMLWT